MNTLLPASGLVFELAAPPPQTAQYWQPSFSPQVFDLTREQFDTLSRDILAADLALAIGCDHESMFWLLCNRLPEDCVPLLDGVEGWKLIGEVVAQLLGVDDPDAPLLNRSVH